MNQLLTKNRQGYLQLALPTHYEVRIAIYTTVLTPEKKKCEVKDLKVLNKINIYIRKQCFSMHLKIYVFKVGVFSMYCLF